MPKIKKTKKEWKEKLPLEEYHILFEKGTEAPFSGKYVHSDKKGVYRCAACGNPLFDSETKFESGSGWPSFFDVLSSNSVELYEDNSLGMRRTEVVCANCGGHLGHLFHDGPRDKTSLRYCINSAALNLEEQK